LYRVPESAREQGLGYSGRTGVYELITLDSTARKRIHDGAGEAELEAVLRPNNPSILAYGAALVMAGITTTEELLRVTAEG
jgi:general secretion pathway protein E